MSYDLVIIHLDILYAHGIHYKHTQKNSFNEDKQEIEVLFNL